MPAYDSRKITEGFPAARAAFEALLADLADPDRSAACAATEEFIATRAREVQRLMLQEWLDQRAAEEQREEEVAGSDGVVRRCAEKSHARLLSTQFGTVRPPHPSPPRPRRSRFPKTSRSAPRSMGGDPDSLDIWIAVAPENPHPWGD